MSFNRTSRSHAPYYRTAAYVTASADVTITTGDTFYAIAATYSNNPLEGFRIGTDAIIYEGHPAYYEIDWHATVKSEDAGRTIRIGVSKNSETLTAGSASVMSIYAKYAAEAVSMSGTVVVQLDAEDTIQLQVTSDTNADVVTVEHFTTTIRPFR